MYFLDSTFVTLPSRSFHTCLTPHRVYLTSILLLKERISRDGIYPFSSFVSSIILDSTWLLPIKFHLYMFLIGYAAIRIVIIGRGVDVSSGVPLDKQRKISNVYKFFCKGILLTSGFFKLDIQKLNIDYTEFLGPNYLKNEEYGTVIANHSTLLDTTILGHLFDCKMVSKSAFKELPLIGRAAELLETIFVD